MGTSLQTVIEAAESKGREAQQAGAPLSDNPYKPHGLVEERRAWTFGYLSEERKEEGQ